MTIMTEYDQSCLSGSYLAFLVINEHQFVSNKHSFVCKRKRLMMSMIDKTLEVSEGNSP